MPITGRKPKPHGLRVLEGGAKAGEGLRFCGSPTESGGQCKLTAGWGTKRRAGPCVHHQDLATLSDEGLPAPPPHLPEKSKELWRKLAPRLMRTGRLEMEDLLIFEGFCMAYYFGLYSGAILIKEGLTYDDKGRQRIAKHPMWQVWKDTMKIWLQCASEFGMTPSSRTRFEIPEVRELTAMERLIEGDG